MALPQTKFRELIFQLLFSYNFTEKESGHDYAFFMEQIKTSKKNVQEAIEIVEKIVPLKSELDQEIAKASTSYDIERIQSVEINILRLALYELRYSKEVPPQVVISEAIRLSKKFSTTESTAFVNAILDHLYKNNTELVYNP